jgi:hypothetical protein
MKKIVILPVHGMGTTDRNYAEELRTNLSKKLGADLWQHVAFHPIYYQHIIQDNQYKVWDDMMDTNASSLDWKKLRQFMLFSFSDAATLEHQSSSLESAYIKAQESIRDLMLKVLTTVPGVTSTTPVILLPHSLGAQVLSNYIWDSNKEEDGGIWAHKPLQLPQDQTDFLKFKTLRHIASAGCNIPLFVAGLPTIKPIRKPHPKFTWNNYYDPDDALGWPLRPLSDEYGALVGKDVSMNSGGFFTSWTPFSHSSYWKDKDFLTPVAATIKSYMK